MEDPALFLDMRLGKSLLTIEYCIRKNLRRVLCLCPKTAIVSWRTELRQEDLSFNLLDTPKKKKAACTSSIAGWYIASTQTLQTSPLNLAIWDAIVIDESSRMKNPKALFTKKLLKSFKTVPHKILLSGTPTPESITESVTQMIFKDGSVLGCKDYWQFRHRHMYLAGFDWKLKRGIYEKLKTHLHKTCISLTSEEAGWDTKVLRKIVKFKLNKTQKEHLTQLAKHFEMTVGDKLFSTKYILPQSIWMHRIVSGFVEGHIINGAKLRWLLRYLGDNVGKQFIIWFRFNDELEMIKDELHHIGLNVDVLWGKCSLDKRIDLQGKFQAGALDVLLIQTKLGQYSLNLSKAHEAIYYTNSYSSEERGQSEKRIAHTDRTTPPSYIDLVFKYSIEEDLLRCLMDKRAGYLEVWKKYQTRRVV